MNRFLFPGAKAGVFGFAITALVMVTIDFGPGLQRAADPVAEYDSRFELQK
ncbi:MAG: hypothetical protein ACKVOL_04070 [Novosphingobium sp.]